MILETAIGAKLLAPKLLALAHHAGVGTAAVKGLAGIGAAHGGGLAAAKTAGTLLIHGVATKAALAEGGKAVLAARHTTVLTAAGRWASSQYPALAVPGGVVGAWLVHKASRKYLNLELELIREKIAERALEISSSRGSMSDVDAWRHAEHEILARFEEALGRHGADVAAFLSS